LRYVWSGTESVANPLDGPAPFCAGIDAYHVETRRVGDESRSGHQKHFGGPNELALLAPVDSQGSARECTGGSKPNLDEYQAIVIQHDKVDFAMAAAIIALDRLESPVLQVSTGELLDGAA
jgi:hypothetical protein